MDTGEDFITPEFLNILFFQQKNLVIFPYVDVKHLHTLEIFTTGHTLVDLESTALHDLKNMLEFESENTYFQSPTLYFIHSLNREKLQEILSIDGIRCVLNSNEDISDLANGNGFIFFNKKMSQFLNYTERETNLDFERFLISNSQNVTVLQDTIQRIKSIATRIFAEVNQNSSFDRIPEFLKDFDQKYWQKILDFTCNYFDIIVPNVSELKKVTPYQILKQSRKEVLQDFSEEYRTIMETNKPIGKEFIQLLHEYRSKKVNPSHLELEELYNPLKLYGYLRNHHWKDGISKDFIKEWVKMSLSGYQLTESDQIDFDNILKELGHIEPKTLPLLETETTNQKKSSITLSEIPTIHDDIKYYKSWILTCLDGIEKSFEKTSVSHLPESFKSELLAEISGIINLVSSGNKTEGIGNEREKPIIVFIDTTNILNEDLSEIGELKIENIKKISNEVKSKGYDFEHIIDANSKHLFDDEETIKKLIKEGKVKQSPFGKKADIFVLECAKRFHGKILSNDGFGEYRNKYDHKWIFNNRLTCKFIRGQFVML
jgi:hypothetical protein